MVAGVPTAGNRPGYPWPLRGTDQAVTAGSRVTGAHLRPFTGVPLPGRVSSRAPHEPFSTFFM